MELATQQLSEFNTQLKKLSTQIEGLSQNKREILTYDETMELLKCSRSFLDSLRKEGTVKVYRLKGRLYCKYSELLAAIDAQLITVDSKAINDKIAAKK